MNNILARNGTPNGPRRGRGICDFSTAEVTYQYNLFFRNEISAFLANGTDYDNITDAEAAMDLSSFSNNIDDNPRFRRRQATRTGRLRRNSPGRNSGNPDAQFNDRNGTRNDIGFTGGPDSLTAGGQP